MSDHFAIRAATPEDADEIAALHRAAILAACASWYSAAQIRAWVGRITPDMHRALMGERRMRVALDDGAVCGFTAASTGAAQINALYVAPFAMHRGAGTTLLADAEEAMLAADRRAVELHATLNAVDFYTWLGYTAHGEVSQRLPGGVAISGVVMRKSLLPT